MITPEFLFLHIPRTGGTSIERALSLGILGKSFGDLTEAEMDEHLLPGPGRVHQHWKFTDCLRSGRGLPPFLFSIIRNPWKLVVSEISYFRTRHHHFANLSWKEAIHKLVTEPAFVWGHDFNPQITWLLDAHGQPVVDFVGRTEELQSHFGMICDKLRLQCPPLERELPSSHEAPPLSGIYDDESREWVALRFAADIAVFGYEFPEDGTGCPDTAPLDRELITQRYNEWRAHRNISPLAFRCPVIGESTSASGRSAAEKYRGDKKWGWYLGDFDGWKSLLHCKEPVRAIEIGAFDGVSANLMLDELFTHPGSEVHCIDPYLPDPTTPEVSAATRELFHANAEWGGHSERIHLYEGLSVEVLAWMIASEGFWEAIDFIYIDGSHTAPAVLTDAVMSWNLLRPGGILVFGDYDWTLAVNLLDRPKPGIDAFASVFGPRMTLLREGGRKIWQKA